VYSGSNPAWCGVKTLYNVVFMMLLSLIDRWVTTQLINVIFPWMQCFVPHPLLASVATCQLDLSIQ
jgi:hypothetical protein